MPTLVTALAVLAVAGCTATKKAETRKQDPLVTVARPIIKEVVEQDEFTGRFEPAAAVEVRARVSGLVETVAFQDGASVKKGDLLFTLDKRPYQMAVEKAEATVSAVEARVKFAEADLVRAQSLTKTGNVSEQLLEQRRQAASAAQADLDGARAALGMARLELDWTEVRAPIAGRIGRKLISEGNLVSANNSLLTTIVSSDPIHFYFDIDERSFIAYSQMLGGVGAHSGDSNETIVEIPGQKLPSRRARLDYVDNRSDVASGSVRVRAVVPNIDQLIKPGFFGVIKLPASPAYQGVLIPDEAIATDQDRRFVWVVASDMTVSAREVKLGPRIDGYRLVRQGLRGDETIIIAGLQRAKANIKVKVDTQSLAPVREAATTVPLKS
jgi:RND family efflux transporter MFP subunit